MKQAKKIERLKKRIADYEETMKKVKTSGGLTKPGSMKK